MLDSLHTGISSEVRLCTALNRDEVWRIDGGSEARRSRTLLSTNRAFLERTTVTNAESLSKDLLCGCAAAVSR